MSARERAGRAMRTLALAGGLVAVFAGGISVAIDLERMLLPEAEAFVAHFPQPAVQRDGGMGFSLVGLCHDPMPPFALLAPILVPILLAMLRPAPRLIELRLRA